MSLFDQVVTTWGKDKNDPGHQLPRQESTKYNRKPSAFFDTTDYSSAENLNNRNLTSFTTYFTLGYYFGVIPFRPQFDRDSDGWKLKKSWIQQAICIFGIWTPFWIFYLTNAPGVFGRFYFMKQLTARSYFVLLRNLVNYGKVVNFFWIINTSSNKLEIILNNAAGSDLFFPSKTDMSERARKCRQAQTKGLIYLAYLYFLFISLSITNFIFVQYPGAPVMSPFDLFPKFINSCRRRFFLELTTTNSTNALAGFTNEELAFGIVEMILRFSNYLNFMMIESFFMGALPITFWIATCNFDSYISSIDRKYSSVLGLAEDDAYAVRQGITEKYEKLKEFSARMNEVWASVNLIWIIDNSMRIIFLLNDAVSTRNALNLVTIFFTVKCWVGTLFFSAEVYRKIQGFKTWLLDRKTRQTFFNRDRYELKMLIKEVENGPVGIGSNGLYQFDYSFTAQLLVVVITLFLVSFEN